MKKITLFFTIFILFNVYTYSQVGIGTTSPKKELHVNGSVQITKELSVGGDSISVGSSGEDGQILFSQGNGKSPVWKTVNIDIDDGDTQSYKLKKTYLRKSGWARIINIDTEFSIGSIYNIKVTKPNNFIYIVSTNHLKLGSTSASDDRVTSADVAFEFAGEKVYNPSIAILSRNGFNDASRSYDFSRTFQNVPVGNYTFTLYARKRKQTTGSGDYKDKNDTLYFNLNPTDEEDRNARGEMIVFVYEK